tara:strand:+ start:215 stop:382 length:168 start_codon:yes stop_codon:yes gene_type:complete
MHLTRIEKKEVLIRRINALRSFTDKTRWMSVQEIEEIRLMLGDIELVLVSIENKE